MDFWSLVNLSFYPNKLQWSLFLTPHKFYWSLFYLCMFTAISPENTHIRCF